MADEPDYYSILEVTPDADESELRLSFRRLARRYHPDVAGTGDLAHMQRLNVAYQTLSDPQARSLYDVGRGIHRAAIDQLVTHDSRSNSGAPISHPPFNSSQAGAASRATRSDAAPLAGTLRHTPGPLRRLATLSASDHSPVTSLAFARAGAVAGLGLIDGRVLIWDVASGRQLHMLSFGATSSAGVLQELRLSPTGRLAVAWGFLLGIRAWEVGDERPLWTAGVNGPSGAMDAALQDEPAQLRLALPDAPLAPAHADPFRWAYEGRKGSAIYSRPLVGAIDPSWARPKRCLEISDHRRAGMGLEQSWRVHQRVLSVDGHRLLTFSTGQSDRTAGAGVLRVWELEHRLLPNIVGPRRVANVVMLPGVAWFPLAATPDLSWVATGQHGTAIRVLAPVSREQRTIDTGPLAADTRTALSPDASLLAVTRGRLLELWQTATGRRVEQWELASEITAVTFATQGNQPLLGVGLGNGLAELWG